MFRRTLNTTPTDHLYRGATETLVKAGTTTYAAGSSGSPLGQKAGSTVSYYLRDPHGDTVGLVSAAAANQGTTAFDPYGRVLGVSGTQPSFGFQSDYTDALTKQVDMGTRWYGPGQGRFSSRDVLFGSLTSPISMNQWVYGGANPVTMHDPTGMRDEQCTGPCDSNTEQRNATAYSEHSSGETWEDSYTTAIRVVRPPTPCRVRCGIDFDADWPERYRSWMEDRLPWINDAAEAYGVPPSVIAGTLATENWRDPRGALKGRAERALAQACRFDLLGVSLCQKRSFGIGQVQIRRAMLVDPAVRHTFGFGSDGCRPGGTTCWDPSPGGIAQRLQNDELAIHYTAAYLGLLRYGHPAGASWEAIYGVPTPIGEFNVDFVDSFAEARHYYSYLDR